MGIEMEMEMEEHARSVVGPYTTPDHVSRNNETLMKNARTSPNLYQ